MTLPRSETEEILRGFVTAELLGGGEPQELRPEDDLLGSGLLDSLGVMRLVRFIEKRFAVRVPPADVTIEHFMTLETIVSYLESLGSRDGCAAG